jgi:hypothetical protein
MTDNDEQTMTDDNEQMTQDNDKWMMQDNKWTTTDNNEWTMQDNKQTTQDNKQMTYDRRQCTTHLQPYEQLLVGWIAGGTAIMTNWVKLLFIVLYSVEANGMAFAHNSTWQ